MQEPKTVQFIPRREVLESLEREFPDFRPYYVEAFQALFLLSGSLDKSLEQFHLKRGFTRGRFLFLMVLLHADGHRLAPNEIAQCLGVTRGNMTGLIDQLMKDDLVMKYEDESDRRKVWVEMTPESHAFLKKMLPEYFKRMAKFMSSIKKQDVEDLIRISRKLSEAVCAFTDEEV
jgi:DNA-binding MarR family transcriptional regulator